jgi:O-antigen ligase
MKVCLWALALVPFMFARNTFFPYATGETLYARGLLALLSIIFVISIFTLPKFRDQIYTRIKSAKNDKLALSVFVFILISIISTIFAINKYNAFWGTVDRAEGLIGTIFFFSVFLFTYLIFNRKDWTIFFQLNLVASFVISVRELLQFLSGIRRSTSFLDNPTFLAGYFLFSLLCAFVVFSDAKKNKFWKYFSIITFILSLLGIFFTETRSTIVGLVAGFVFVLIYGIYKGKDIFYKKNSLRKIATITLCVFMAFSFLFITTRHSVVWQSIPAVGRIANIGGSDSTTQTRLISNKVSLKAVNPVTNGLKKFIIGWGPDNYSIAYGKYFNPKQFDYEMRWFDRSHNKLMDTFVMTGLLGLLAYLAMYFYLFKPIFKRDNASIVDASLLFFGVSMLVHLLFVFDQITTSIPFFAVLAFSIYLVYLPDNIKIQNKKNTENINKKIWNIAKVSFVVFSIFLTFIFFRNDVVACIQMKKYIGYLNNKDKVAMLHDANLIFEPITSSRANLLKSFLLYADEVSNDVDLKLSDIAINKAEDYVQKAPFDIKFYLDIGTAYTKKGKIMKDQSMMDRGEMYFRKMLIYSQNRPDSNFGLALNLFYQKKYDESFVYSEKAFNLSPAYFIEQNKNINEIYPVFFQYFYNKKDKVNFLQTAKRLKDSEYITDEVFNQIDTSLNKYNTWPYINFHQL